MLPAVFKFQQDIDFSDNWSAQSATRLRTVDSTVSPFAPRKLRGFRTAQDDTTHPARWGDCTVYTPVSAMDLINRSIVEIA